MSVGFELFQDSLFQAFFSPYAIKAVWPHENSGGSGDLHSENCNAPPTGEYKPPHTATNS